MAEHLVDQGKDVTVLTCHAEVAPMTHYTLEYFNLHRMMHEKGIKHLTTHWVEEVEVGNSLKVKSFYLLRDGYKRATEYKHDELPREASSEINEVECDTVVLVTGRKANKALYDALHARRDEWSANEINGIYQAGDCYAPRLTADCVFDGHRIARELDEPNPQKQKKYKRERMIWG